MRFTLKEYQNDAVGQMLTNLADARDDFHRKHRNVAFSLAATTGAGKTVMASAVIEALLFGNDDWNFDADPGALILWFTDDPSLNEQTRARILDASGDRLAHSRLEVIENSFNQEKLDAGKVYFLNAQKLSKNSLLVRGVPEDDEGALIPRSAVPDLRAYTIWDTIRNTIQDDTLTLYVILDEAHKGMRQQSQGDRADRQTIVKRLVNGEGAMPPVPIVWGISATIDRFTAAMAEAEGRTTYPPYEVDPVLIQESGLLKDDIRLAFPTERGDFDTVLLKRGVEQIKQSTRLWAEYAASQESTADAVVPLLVVQVPNKASNELLGEAVDAIREEWPQLGHDGVANVFGEHATLELPGESIPYVSPETVQDRTHIRVLLAKDAISTGWDCPRAEVLVSYRPAADRTHITQMLGRMVRTPLARRIVGDDVLNSVFCLLPKFERSTAEDVARALLGSHGGDRDASGTGGGEGRRVLFKPVDMEANAAVGDDVWAAFDLLPSQTLPRKAAKPTKRLTALAQALSRDELLPDARKAAYKELFALLDGLRVRFSDEVDKAVADILEVEGETIAVSTGSGTVTSLGVFAAGADERSIEADFKAAGRVLSPDIARKYAEHVAGDDIDDDGLLDAHIVVAGLARVPRVSDELDREADRLSTQWLNEYRVSIKALSDERRAVYADIRAMSSDPQRADILRPRIRSEETEDSAGNKIDTRKLHLMSDERGNFPIASLNGWELEILDREMTRAGARAWYRNPGRASDDSLAVAYMGARGNWRRVCPDFIFFHEIGGTVRASIVDPHGFHLADSMPKLRGLANFAAEYSSEFHRIEAVAKLSDGRVRVLDLTDAAVRGAIGSSTAESAEQLYVSTLGGDY
ncbi:MAG: DEAD/DEAH box helicase family protein [Propionibacteriaceae bacterium]